MAFGWMLVLVAEAHRDEVAAGLPSDPRKQNWKNSAGWYRLFKGRFGWTNRRATNKRSHSAEDLIGDVLGFVRFLRELRQKNQGLCPTWGAFGLETTFNQDTVPVSFCNSNNTTLERVGAERVSIRLHGSGLDKRQASLHLLIRPWGEQPWPKLILRGATTKDGKRDTKARAAELALFKQYKVHVIFQKKAWMNGFVAPRAIAQAFEEDLERLGLEGVPTLLISDNLDVQRSLEFRQELHRMLMVDVFGPRNGTDVWQPVDHGVGSQWQRIIYRLADEWCKTEEAIEHFRTNTSPSAARLSGTHGHVGAYGIHGTRAGTQSARIGW
jgi:hypothetical protein